jgi:enediyne biosynthesis thioesterase
MIHESTANGASAGTAGIAATGSRDARYYEYRHIVSFEETNLVGNVYYVNHLRWQGRCREMFLYDHGVDVLKDFNEGFAMVTVRVSCDYLSELCAFDTLSIRMSLGELVQNRITLRFEYWKRVASNSAGAGEQWELVARGEQQVACMRRDADRLAPAPVPEKLREVLKRYG